MTQSKLIVITRRDLNSPTQAVQSTHAAIQFQHEHPELAKNWYNNSNYLVSLSVENEEELFSIAEKLQKSNILVSIFREPDIKNQVTAIAFASSEKTRKYTSNLPLMLKELKKEKELI